MPFYNLILLPALLLWSSVLYAGEVGRLQYTHGMVTMQAMDGSNARIVAKDERIGLNEVIKTGPGSFAVVRLHDNTLLTLRPNSIFAVERFSRQKQSSVQVSLHLYRGGIRGVTGMASKRSGTYQLQTPISTVSLQEAVFDARLCEDDCEEENNQIRSHYKQQLETTVARVVYLQGSLLARSSSGKRRVLRAGSAILEGDTLVTNSGSYAILVFRDQSRVSLQADTVFRIDKMKYDSKSEADSASSFSLLRGGLRSLSGRQFPAKYRIHTILADIGINGTGFDLVCTGPCEASDSLQLRPLRLKEGDGLYAHVWQGSIHLGKLTLPTGKTAYLPGRDRPVKVLSGVPAFLKNNKVPRPDRVKIDDSDLFGTMIQTEVPHGLYISVSRGNVRVKTRIGMLVELDRGQASYTDALGRLIKKLDSIPAFQRYDRYPTPDSPNPDVSPLSSTISNGAITSRGSGTVCEIR